MAVRIRKNKTIVCAATSKKRKSDCYLDDGIHYVLAVELKVMSFNEKTNLWEFHKPKKLLGKLLVKLPDEKHNGFDLWGLGIDLLKKIIVGEGLPQRIVIGNYDNQIQFEILIIR